MKNTTNRPLVTVTQDYKASPEEVFEAWIDTNKISQWMFGKAVRDEEIISLKTDPRKGGQFSFVVQRGKDVLNHMGTYLEVLPYTRLSFTWGVDQEAGEESIVTIEITPTESGCRLTLTHDMDAKWAEYAQRTEAGWTYMLGKMQALLQ